MNPDDWPNVDLKPSKGSVNRQRYVGPGGENIDNLGELTVEVCTERHGGGDISSRMTFLGAKVRKPLLAVSGVIDKGNMVVLDGSGSFILPNSCAGVASVRKAITRVQGRIPLHAKNRAFVLRTWEPEVRPSTDFSRRGAPVRPLKEKEWGAVGELSNLNPRTEVPEVGPEAPNVSARGADDVDVGDEVAQSGVSDAESIEGDEVR